MFGVRATDSGNNVDPSPAERSFTVDTSVPVVAITSQPPDPTNDPTAEFEFTVDDPAATPECRVDAEPFEPCSGPGERHVTAPLADGAHTFEVLARDPAGNTSLPASAEFVLDTDPPETTITSGPSGTTSERTPTFAFKSDESPSTLECRFDSGAYEPCESPRTVGPLDVGAHSFKVRATDEAANTDPTPAERDLRIVSATPGSAGSSGSLPFTGAELPALLLAGLMLLALGGAGAVRRAPAAMAEPTEAPGPGEDPR